jgi:hypothetical protein
MIVPVLLVNSSVMVGRTVVTVPTRRIAFPGACRQNSRAVMVCASMHGVDVIVATTVPTGQTNRAARLHHLRHHALATSLRAVAAANVLTSSCDVTGGMTVLTVRTSLIVPCPLYRVTTPNAHFPSLPVTTEERVSRRTCIVMGNVTVQMDQTKLAVVYQPSFLMKRPAHRPNLPVTTVNVSISDFAATDSMTVAMAQMNMAALLRLDLHYVRPLSVLVLSVNIIRLLAVMVRAFFRIRNVMADWIVLMDLTKMTAESKHDRRLLARLRLSLHPAVRIMSLCAAMAHASMMIRNVTADRTVVTDLMKTTACLVQESLSVHRRHS